MVKLKHGRVSMPSYMSYIVPVCFKFPGYLVPSIGLKLADVPDGVSALSRVPGIGCIQSVLSCGFEKPGKLRARLFGDDLSFREFRAHVLPCYLGNKSLACAERRKKSNIELANMLPNEVRP